MKELLEILAMIALITFMLFLLEPEKLGHHVAVFERAVHEGAAR